MVNVDGANIAITSGYSNTNVLTTETLHHFWFDTNIFIYRDCQYRNRDEEKTLMASGGPYHSRDHAMLYPMPGLAFLNTCFSPGFCLPE